MIRAGRGEVLLLGLLDLLVVAGAFGLAFWLRFEWDVAALTDAPAPPLERYAEALGVVLIVFHLVLRTKGLYEALPPRGIDVLEDTVGAVTLGSVIVLAASFFQREFTYSRSVTLLAWALLCLLLPLPRVLLQRRRRRRWAAGQDLVPALVVGSPARAHDLAARLANRRWFGIDLRGRVRPPGEPEAAPSAALGAGPALPVLGALTELEAAAGRCGAREVLITDGLSRLELLETLERCEREGLEARVVPQIYDLFVTEGDLTGLHGVPFVSIREQRFPRLAGLAKRAMDLLLGVPLLLASLPLLALLVWRVRRESPGPGLFVQVRVGERGRRFRMWKLRTMVQDASERLGQLVDLERLPQPVFKLQDDPRVTPLGRFLRRSSLDELPQLWNVVKGDMSLVGPRPEEEAIVLRYDAHQRRRLKARPGLTGLQQIEARAVTDLDERVRLDVYYIRRRTLLFDLWILLRTPLAVLKGDGAT